MTQAQVADRLGVNRVTVRRWETTEGEIGYVQSLALQTFIVLIVLDVVLVLMHIGKRNSLA